MSNDPIGDALEITTSDGRDEVTPVSAMSKSLKIQEKKKQI